jgi:hypothetical protein
MEHVNLQQNVRLASLEQNINTLMGRGTQFDRFVAQRSRQHQPYPNHLPGYSGIPSTSHQPVQAPSSNQMVLQPPRLPLPDVAQNQRLDADIARWKDIQARAEDFVGKIPERLKLFETERSELFRNASEVMATLFEDSRNAFKDAYLCEYQRREAETKEALKTQIRQKVIEIEQFLRQCHLSDSRKAHFVKRLADFKSDSSLSGAAAAASAGP